MFESGKGKKEEPVASANGSGRNILIPADDLAWYDTLVRVAQVTPFGPFCVLHLV